MPKAILLGMLLTVLATPSWPDDVPVVRTRPGATFLEKLAAREVRRYVYLRTGKLLPMAAGSATGAAIVLETDPALQGQQYRLRSDGAVLTISGGSG